MFELEQVANKREHDADVAGRARAENRTQLRAEHIWVFEREANAAEAEEGIRFIFGERHAGHFIGTEVDRSHDDGLAAERARHGGVGLSLFLFRRFSITR